MLWNGRMPSGPFPSLPLTATSTVVLPQSLPAPLSASPLSYKANSPHTKLFIYANKEFNNHYYFPSELRPGEIRHIGFCLQVTVP